MNELSLEDETSYRDFFRMDKHQFQFIADVIDGEELLFLPKSSAAILDKLVLVPRPPRSEKREVCACAIVKTAVKLRNKLLEG